MILADTSVWIEHLFRSEPTMKERLEAGLIVMHPFVMGEFALGRMRQRDRVLYRLSLVPRVLPVAPSDILTLVDKRKLDAAGIGYVDAHLLASVLRTPSCRLWTFDRRLAALAASLGVAEAVH